jgi:serine/threonine-protein kinase
MTVDVQTPPPPRDRDTTRSAVAASPVAIADFLLACLVNRNAVAVRLEPEETLHRIVIQGAGGTDAQVTLPWETGDAVTVRLALLAGVDVVGAAGGSAMGRTNVRYGSKRSEVLAVLTTSPRGMQLELRRVVGEAETRKKAAPARRVREPDARRIDDYRLYEELGRGGTGVVYCAQHEALEKLVALKVLHPSVASVPEAAAMLLREGRAASRIRHPGIVDVTDFGRAEDGRMFLVMELVPWPTLHAVFSRETIAPARIVNIIRNLLLALEAAHAEGLIHRDLKPSNVFVGPDEQVKLTDFGSAVALAGRRPLDRAAHVPLWGTAEYMAPEHSTGKADRRSDVYAVGCMLYLLLTGRLPFSNESTEKLQAMHAHAAIPPLDLPEGSNVPPLMEEVVRRAMAKAPEERYQTAAEMARDLERVAIGLKRKGWQKWLPL